MSPHLPPWQRAINDSSFCVLIHSRTDEETKYVIKSF